MLNKNVRSKMFFLIISIIIACEYLGPLLFSEIGVKIFCIIPTLLFVIFLEIKKNYKVLVAIGSSILLVLIPFSSIYSTIAIVIITLLSVLEKILGSDIKTDFQFTLFTFIFIQISLLYHLIPLVFNFYEHLSFKITNVLSLGTELGTNASLLIPLSATILTLILTAVKFKSIKPIYNILFILPLYAALINLNVFILVNYSLISTWLLPLEAILIVMFAYPFKVPNKTISGSGHRTFRSNFLLFVFLILNIPLILTLLFPLFFNQSSFKPQRIAVVASEEEFVNVDKDLSRENSVGFGYSPFMFSSFKLYLESIGHTIETYNKIDHINYTDTDILLLIHYNTEPSQNNIREVEQFVKNGGTVIAFNDHNNLFNASECTNKLLEFSTLKINDDISDNILSRLGIVWQNSLYEYMNNPIKTTIKLSNETNLGVWGGASISSKNYFATPLIIAKNGISDPSLEKPNSQGEYMANRRLDYGEGYGNIPLAYAVKYGLGSVALYGDASYIQTPQSMLNWYFLYSTFDINNRAFIPNSLQMLCLVLSIVYIYSLYKFIFSIDNKHLATFLGCLLMFILMGIFSNVHILNSNQLSCLNNISGKYNIIDNTHDNYISVALTEDDSVGGIGYISMTQKQPIFVLNKDVDIKSIIGTNNYIIINPQKMLDPLKVDKLLGSGTDVILIAGKEYLSNTKAVLEKYGISFDERFLGPIPWKNPILQSTYSIDDGPEFMEAWNLNFDENFQIKPLYKYKDYVPAVCARINNANFYFIGDSRFLDKNNIEGEFKGKINNIRFIEDIIAR